MKRYIKFLILGLAALTTFSCVKDNNNTLDIPRSALRMVNAYSNSQSILFTVDNKYITSPYSPLGYSEYSQNVVLLYPGNRTIRVYRNQNEKISENSMIFKDSTYYTSFVFGNTNEAKNIITEDKRVNNLANNEVAIRFLHLASNQGSVNVYLDNIDDAIYEDRSPETTTSQNISSIEVFSPQTSGTRKVIITDENDTILLEREYNFVKSKYYSIILIGDKNSSNKPLYLGIVQQ